MAAQYRVGLDIGFSLIKIAVLSHKERPPRLISLGHVASPQPGMVSEADLDLEAVATAIKNLANEVKIPTKDVTVSIPESKIFTRVVYDLPFLTDQELTQAIRYAAEEFVPMPIAEVNLNYQIIFRSPQKTADSRTVVFVVATPKAVINKYLRLLQMADLHPTAVETELLSVNRALVSSDPYSPTTMIVQLGASNTDFAVVSEGLILLTRSIPTGGIALTRTIAQNFNFEMIQAEEYKKVYGLLEDQLEGKLYQALKPIVDVIVLEARRVVQAHQAQNPQRPIKRVVLTGGGAQLPGLVRYFATALELETQEADPWVGVAVDPNLKAKLTAEGATYSVAVGLALRED